MIEITKKENCCGCTACMNICPVNAVQMREDEEGFLYPMIDTDICIQCGKCDKICPILNERKEEQFEQKAYILNNKNNAIRMQSTSGGAFTAIAEYVIQKNGVVFGAVFDDDFCVIHAEAKTIEELAGFRSSKYVQSDLKDTFSKTKTYLDEGKIVCFSGTPCQIEGLKKFLDKEYDHLITVDVVCRAVPSPKLYRKYLDVRKRKMKGSVLKEVVFRDKRTYGYRYTTMTIKTDKEEYKNGVESDPYLRAFFHNLSDRPACHECHFKKQFRVSDFTIWDCFITEEFNKTMDDNIGTTRMLVHTDKGRDVFNDIKEQFVYKEIDPNIIVKDIKEIKIATPKNPKREEFFNDMNHMEEDSFLQKYFPDNMKVKLERYSRKLLVKFPIYKKIKKILKKVIKR